MSDQFRVLSPEASELQPILNGLFGEYAARYGDYFSRDAEVELTEWYLAPQGLLWYWSAAAKLSPPGLTNLTTRTPPRLSVSGQKQPASAGAGGAGGAGTGT